MSDLSKKIAMFNQKSLNNNNNSSNNINNNINKKNENKGNKEMKNQLKLEILKREEKKNLKNLPTNANNNQQSNQFQNKLTMFQQNEKNNSPKQINKEIKKLETNKKENKNSSENKNFSGINKNENAPKTITSEKINMFSNNSQKEKEPNIIKKEKEAKNSFSQKINIFNHTNKENETKGIINNGNEQKKDFSDKINIFAKNKKENEIKINNKESIGKLDNKYNDEKINNKDNKDSEQKEAINKEKDKKNNFLQKIYTFNKDNKEKEVKIVNKENVQKSENIQKTDFSEKINMFKKNNKEYEQKPIIQNNNQKENHRKSAHEGTTNIINNKKGNESIVSQTERINNFSNKENGRKTIAERLNIFSNKENSKKFSSEKNNNSHNNKTNNKPKAISSEKMNIFNNKKSEEKITSDEKKYIYNQKKERGNKIENSSNDNPKLNNNKFNNIINQINSSSNNKKDNEISPSVGKPQVINNNNLESNNKELENYEIISDDDMNNENIIINTNLNINKIKEEKNNVKKSNSNKIVTSTPQKTKKISQNYQNSMNFQNDKDEIGEIFLETDLIPETVINETFCMGFFITSFNIKNPQIIENSKELSSECGHYFCTISQAIKPEIIFRYPQKDTKDFEISELGASICFPNGIKICYEKNEVRIKNTKNFSSILTNQNGRRYFMMTYHYYYKLPSKDFNKNSDFFKSLDNQFRESIGSNKYIYIPCCLSLLSKYPYFSQMDKCLETMRFSLENFDSNPSEIYDLIIYFIKSIPIPPLGTKLFFPLPYYPELISINQPFYKDSIIFGDNPVILLEYLSVEEIIIIFRLLLFEQKILIIGCNYHDIAQFTYNFILLLYPLQWVHTQISIMTEKMMKYLQSFLPFFNGMHNSLYELTSNILESITENIFIIDINKRTFEMNTNPSFNTKNVIKKINEILPQLPKSIHNNMTFGLGILKSYFDKKKEEKNININNAEEVESINMKIKHVFIQTFLEILYDYKNYLSVIGGKPIFNTNGLLEKRPKNESNFYKEFTTTQLFQMFIQNNTDSGDKKNETFFEEQLNIYSKLKVKTDYREEFINNYIGTTGIYKYNIIKFDKLNNFDLNNSKKSTLKNEEELTLNDYQRYINQKYFSYTLFFKPNCINLKSNKRILKNKIVLEHNKIPSKYQFYIIPNQQFNFEVEKRKKSIRYKNLNETKTKLKKGELTQEQKDDIRENIIDVLTKIFKNEEIEDLEENKKLIMDSLLTDYGRELYTNVLIENSNITNESSFQFLTELIYDSIQQIKIKSKEKRLIYCLKLIKCCQNFRKEENKKFIYLSDILYPKFQKLQIISDLNFWKEWSLLDFKSQKVGKDDDKWIITFRNLEKIMPKLGCNKTSIYSTIAELAKNNIKDEPTFLRYMREVVQNLEIFKS